MVPQEPPKISIPSEHDDLTMKDTTPKTAQPSTNAIPNDIPDEDSYETY